MKSDLNLKQTRFVDEYQVDLNATKAAIRAGYSEKTAGVQGHELLKKPKIAAKIQEEFQKRAKKVNLTAEMVIREMMRLAFINVKHLYDDDGNFLPIKDLPDDVACAISGVDLTELKALDGEGDIKKLISQTKKIKFWDKRAALETLGKHLGLFNGGGETPIDEPIPDEFL